jgi:hypothetical protein
VTTADTNPDPYTTGPKVWDKIEDKTDLSREAVKSLIYAIIYGGPVIHICKNYNLELSDVVAIKMAFDDIMSGREPL